jgi:hypothetical protein
MITSTCLYRGSVIGLQAYRTGSDISSVASAETLQTPNSTYGFHHVLGCVNLEVLSGDKLMATHYCQTANWLLPVNLGKFPRNSALQVYNTPMHGYDISLHL